MYNLKLAINLLFKQNLDFLETKNKDRIYDILLSLYKIEKLIRENKLIKKEYKKIILNNTQFLILTQTFDSNLSLEDFNQLIELKEESTEDNLEFSLFCYISKEYLLKRIENVIQNNQVYSEKFSVLPETISVLKSPIILLISGIKCVFLLLGLNFKLSENFRYTSNFMSILLKFFLFRKMFI